MRVLTILTGLLVITVGAFLTANTGLTFISLAFIAGLTFVIAGIVTCLSYTGYRGDNESKNWILVDGTVTFVLGVLILMNRLTADVVVPYVLATWVMTIGIRNFVQAWVHWDLKNTRFYNHFIIGILNLVFGIYVFFDGEIFNLAPLTLIGFCMIVAGVNIVNVGWTIHVIKPDFIKTKEEMVVDAARKFEEAHNLAKEAIKAAKDAKEELKAVAETPEELLDAEKAPRPEGEKIEQ